jgi:hypothetical protein
VDDKLDDLREDIERLQKRWQEEEIELERRANEAEKRWVEKLVVLSPASYMI